jgi:hypothetical protein
MPDGQDADHRVDLNPAPAAKIFLFPRSGGVYAA